MKQTNEILPIFEQVIADYHKTDSVDQLIRNPYEKGTFEELLYHKCWIDAVQWHLEDIIREPQIDPSYALQLKRRIDLSNQDRTNLVENIDAYFFNEFGDVTPQADAKINTETPAWALDRLSILMLKIFHMKEQTERTDVDDAHREGCQQKLDILLMQKADLSQSIDELLVDLQAGRRKMRLYKQMKMYNDPKLNPVFYKKK